MRTFFAAILVFAMAAGQAAADCALVWRLHRISQAILDDPLAVTQDTERLRQMGSLSADGVASGLADTFDTTDLRKLTDFAALVELAGLVGLTGRRAEAQSRLTSSTATALLQQTDSLLAASECVRMASPEIRDLSGLTTRESDEAEAGRVEDRLRRPSRRISQDLALVTLAISTVSFVALIWAWRRIKAAQTERRRRARRFAISAPVEGIVRGKFVELWLLDLSGSGVKLRHGGVFEEGDHFRFKLDLLGLRDLTIVWTNAHYVGAEFAQSLSLVEMAAVLRDLQKRMAEAEKRAKENGALGAPL